MWANRDEIARRASQRMKKNGLNQEYENTRTEIDLLSRISEFKYC